MGMYTALSLGVQFKEDTPRYVIDAIKQMIYGSGVITSHPSHEFFDCDRWQMLLRCDSYYFDWQTRWSFEYDDISRSYYLSGVSNLKNYGGEIKKFLDWVTEYLDTEGYLGWTMYEEQEWPDIITRGYDNELYFTRTEHFVGTDIVNQANAKGFEE